MESHEVARVDNVRHENGIDESSQSCSDVDEVFEEAPEIMTNSDKLNQEDIQGVSQVADAEIVSVGSVEHHADANGDNDASHGNVNLLEDANSDVINGESQIEKSKDEGVNLNDSTHHPDDGMPVNMKFKSLSGESVLDTSKIGEVTDLNKLDHEKSLEQRPTQGTVNGADIPEDSSSVPSDASYSSYNEEHTQRLGLKDSAQFENEGAGVVDEGSEVHFNKESDIKALNAREMDSNLASEFPSEKNVKVDDVSTIQKEDMEKEKKQFDLPTDSSSSENGVLVQKPVLQDVVSVSSSTNDIKSHPATIPHTKSVPEPPSRTNASSNRTRPAGLGRGASLLEPSARGTTQPRANGTISASHGKVIEDNSVSGDVEEYDEIREKLQMIRVKFLRLAHRLGQTPHNVVVAQVLYRLGLAEQLHGRSGGRVAAFSFDRASAMAEQLEALGQEPLDFTCTIMVLGKSGVGKSATINSIFDEIMFSTNAFQSGTQKVQDIVGTVQGIRVRVIDTPGLLPSCVDQRHNEKILQSVKKFIKKTPPDIILYLDRLDLQNRDFGDAPLLRTITGIFGTSIWFNAIVVLTHAASAPPEGPNGTVTSYDMFVSQRSLVIQQAIRQAAGDTRLMNPVSLVENHSACRTNRAGQRVLPNGQVWKPHLLLLSFASKILAEANTLLKLQDTPPGRPHASHIRSHPLPFLLSSLLQSRSEIKLPSDQFSDDDDDCADDNMEVSLEEVSEYDELPPFKPLKKAELEKLTKMQRKAYFDELEYRERLFINKQLKEEKKRRKMMKRMKEAAKDLVPEYSQNSEEDAGAAASVPVPMPDLVLPASFDSGNPTYRYRSLDNSNPWLMRAVLEQNVWDHDIGYDGVNVERLFVLKDVIPVSFSSHVSKDKKDMNLQMEVASTMKYGKGKATSLGFDMKSIGKDYAYTVRSETKFSSNKINKAVAGLSATVLGDIVTGGVKLEDKLTIGNQAQFVVSGGAIYGRGEVAFGGSLEATLKEKDQYFGRFLSTFGLSIMDWHGDLAIGCNSQTQIPVGRHTNLIGCFNVNNRGSGQISIRVNSSDQLQIVLVGLIPLVKKLLGYSQQAQY